MPGKILVIDDEPELSTIITEYLNEIGYECSVASRGPDALQNISGTSFDAILCDINMPGMNGIEVLRRIKKKDVDLQVIMVSAIADIQIVRKSLREGAYDYLLKPIDFDELEITLKRAMEHVRLIRTNREYQKNLEQKVEERTMELADALSRIRKTYQETILAMGSALETRDVETQAHAHRVSHYSRVIAGELGMSDDVLIDLERGAFLHDIGKIGVSDTILLKPAPLTESEWQVMRQHPDIGRKMVEGIEFLEGSIPIIQCHHEYYDGSGYPGGFRNDDIPIEARIFSLADALDAITSDRPYRAAATFEQAKAEISKSAGTHFDPELVRIFNGIPENKLTYRAD